MTGQQRSGGLATPLSLTFRTGQDNPCPNALEKTGQSIQMQSRKGRRWPSEANFLSCKKSRINA
jgi:hypothetical protein